MVQTGERGKMHAEEEETAKVAIEEAEVGGREKKGRARPPPFPASQPAPSHKLPSWMGLSEKQSQGLIQHHEQ